MKYDWLLEMKTTLTNNVATGTKRLAACSFDKYKRYIWITVALLKNGWSLHHVCSLTLHLRYNDSQPIVVIIIGNKYDYKNGTYK